MEKQHHSRDEEPVGPNITSLTLHLYTHNSSGLDSDRDVHDVEEIKVGASTTVEDVVEQACEHLQLTTQLAMHFGLVRDGDEGRPLPPGAFILHLLQNCAQPPRRRRRFLGRGGKSSDPTPIRYWLRLVQMLHIDHVERSYEGSVTLQLSNRDERALNYLYRQMHWDLQHGVLAEAYREKNGLPKALGLCTTDMVLQVREASRKGEDLQASDCRAFLPKTLSSESKSSGNSLYELIGRLLGNKDRRLLRHFLSRVRDSLSKWESRTRERQKSYFISLIMQTVPQYGEVRYSCRCQMDKTEISGDVTVFPPTHPDFGIVWQPKPDAGNVDAVRVPMTSITLVTLKEFMHQAIFTRSDGPQLTLCFLESPEWHLFSLLTLLNGYQRLSVGWHRSLCDTYAAPGWMKRREASIHPPLRLRWVHETLEAFSKLGNPRLSLSTQHSMLPQHYLLHLYTQKEPQPPQMSSQAQHTPQEATVQQPRRREPSGSQTSGSYGQFYVSSQRQTSESTGAYPTVQEDEGGSAAALALQSESGSRDTDTSKSQSRLLVSNSACSNGTTSASGEGLSAANGEEEEQGSPSDNSASAEASEHPQPDTLKCRLPEPFDLQTEEIKLMKNTYYLHPCCTESGQMWRVRSMLYLSRPEDTPEPGPHAVCSRLWSSPASLLRHLSCDHNFPKAVEYAFAAERTERSRLLWCAPEQSMRVKEVRSSDRELSCIQLPETLNREQIGKSGHTKVSRVTISVQQTISGDELVLREKQSRKRQRLSEFQVELGKDEVELSRAGEQQQDQATVHCVRRVNKEVALKELCVDSSDAKACLLEVARVCSAWRHEALVQVLYLVLPNSLVLQLVPSDEQTTSPSLEVLSSKVSLSVAHKLQVLFQVARALLYLFDRQEAHGNVTLHNILVLHYRKESVCVQLGDPGLAAYYLTLDQTQPAVKKRWAYYAPEYKSQWAKAKHQLTPAADHYSYGILATRLFFPEQDLSDMVAFLGEKNEPSNQHRLLLVEEARQRVKKQLIVESLRYTPEERLKPRFALINLTRMSRDLNTSLWVSTDPHYEYPNYTPANPPQPLNTPVMKFQNRQLKGVIMGEEKRGQGHFGEVKTGVYQNKTVAIKVLLEKKYSDAERRMLLEQEMSMMEEARHENIVKILGYFEHPSTKNLCAVMELMESSCLKFFPNLTSNCGEDPQERPWAETVHARVLTTAFQVAEGLTFLHDKNIVHLDLAARNVLVNGNGKTRICDLGLAKRLNEHGQTEKFCGNVPWKIYPVETYEFNYARRTTDVWSFGLFVRELLCLAFTKKGPAPFAPNNLSASEVVKHLRKAVSTRHQSPRLPPFDLPSETIKSLENLVLKCLRVYSEKPANPVGSGEALGGGKEPGPEPIVGPRPTAAELRQELLPLTLAYKL